MKGTLMPGESASSVFSFDTHGWAGVHTEGWVLETEPRVRFTLLPEDPQAAEAAHPTTESVQFTLHGQSYELDETQAQRDTEARALDAASFQSFVRDEIMLCLRRVRDPIRHSTLDVRRRAVFERINKALLQQTSKAFAAQVPLYITPERISTFSGISGE